MSINKAENIIIDMSKEKKYKLLPHFRMNRSTAFDICLDTDEKFDGKVDTDIVIHLPKNSGFRLLTLGGTFENGGNQMYKTNEPLTVAVSFNRYGDVERLGEIATIDIGYQPYKIIE